MINQAIQLLAAQLNQHFRRVYDLNEDRVVVSNLLEIDGSAVSNIDNKLVMFLANIEKDTVSYRSAGAQEIGERSVLQSAPINFNLYVMLTANFAGSNYAEALRSLSSAIGFFQRKSMFNHQNTPEMDKSIEKLVLDIENLSVQDLSNLWSTLGGKYMPSVYYRVRMVTFDSSEIAGRQPVITAPKPSVGSD